MSRTIFRTLTLLALCASISPVSRASAQGTTTSGLTGVVKDAQGAVVPGASVKAVHEPSGTTYVTTVDASGTRSMRLATDEEIAAAAPAAPRRTLARSLPTALLAVVTVLAHGAMIVSLGLALGIWIRGRGKAVTASVGLVLFVTVGGPILYLLAGYPTHLRGSTLASPLVAISVLLFDTYSDDVIAEILGWVAYWDVLIALLTVVVAGLAIRTLDRKSRGFSPLGNEVPQEEPAGESEQRVAGDAWREIIRPIGSRPT